MIDHADKSWLRTKREPFVVRALELAWRCALMALFLATFAALLAALDARAAPATLVLLEPSSQAATLDECQRRRPDLGRPSRVISLQNGSLTNWHHRVCTWK